MSLHRRRLLTASATAGLLGLAGCLESLGDETDASNATQLHLTLVEAPTPLREGYVVEFADTRRPDDDEAFAAALAGESYTTQYRTPFGSRPDDPKYVRHEGTYYQLGSVVVDEAAVTHPVLRLSEVADAESSDAPEAVQADSLSEDDRTAVHVAHMAARARGNPGGVPWGLVQRGGYVYRDAERAVDSRLLGDDAQSHVAYRGTVYDIDVTREEFHEPVYRATAEPVAESPERLEAILRAQFVDARLSRESLSDEERAILRTARGDGYEESHPYTEAYRSVLTGLDARAYLDGNIEKDAYTDDLGTGILLYGETYYDYRLRFV